MKHRKKTITKLKRNSMQKREERKAWLFLLPSFTGISVFVLIPFGDVVRRSFYQAMGKTFVGLDNFKNLFSNEAFQLAAYNTGRFLLTCIPLLLLVSLFLSALIFEQKKLGNIFKMSFLIPLAIPVASVVLLWKIFLNNNGLLNKLVSMFGGTTVDWMNTSNAFYILVFSYLWKNIGYDMVLWLSGLDGISSSLYEAASIDGAGAWKKFKYITLPGLVPTLFVVFVLSLINSFKVFREAYLIAGKYPDKSIYMLQHLFNNWFIDLDLQKICAAAVVVAGVMLCFILILLRATRRREIEG